MLTNEQFRAQLQKIKDGDRNPAYGICSNTEQAGGMLITAIASTWPGYSGDYFYPVPSKIAGMEAKEYYYYCSKNKTLWKDYDRIALLDYIIEVTSSVVFNTANNTIILANGAEHYYTLKLHAIRTGVI